MKSPLLRLLGCSSFAAGCALAFTLGATPAQAGPVLPEVGPTPPGVHDKIDYGSLVVFSRTEQKEWGENTYYYPHTAYWIYDASGHRLRTVENHDSEIDESPSQVHLAPGHYVVKAWSDSDGLVTVPVVIKLAQTTTVHLEDSSRQASDSREVQAPSGNVVGWKA